MQTKGGSMAEPFERWWTPDFKIVVEHARRDAGREDIGAFLPHMHPQYAFVFCQSGRMKFSCGGQVHVLEPGEMLVHNAGQIHQSWYGLDQQGWECVSVVVDRAVIRQVLLRMSSAACLQDKGFMFLGKIHDPGVARQAKDLVEELETEKLGYDLVVKSLVIQILVYLFRNCIEPTITEPLALPPQLPAWEADMAMRYMSTCGKTDFNLSKLCATLGTSASRFVPLFKNSTSLNPHVYFNKIIVERAERLLRAGECSVKETAYELGFQNPSHFCRFFHRMVGTTPRGIQLLGQP
jgi:AraC family transcriptional regulator